MHLHIEESEVRRSDSTVHSLSWMGKVPDTTPDAEGWKLHRSNYYQEGWLATGNSKGLVGATFTTCHCKKNYNAPWRTNFNLRGHRSEVSLVRWNEPYQKLATCDYTGVIFVWIKHEGRWSIELINDRNSQVTDFAWSHDGRMALICYRDGFVLVGSVTGQRFWSSTLQLDNCMTTCAVWSPDDQQVLFGTSDGQVVVMSSTGAMITQAVVAEGQEIVALTWSCEKFNLSEEGMAENNNGQAPHTGEKKQHMLAVNCHSVIYLMSNYDDLCPKVIHTGLTGIKIEWSNDGELLAVGGFKRWPNLECKNEVRFYTKGGVLRYRLEIEKKGKPLTALTWGHNDRRLFVSVGCYIFTVWVTKKIAPLQFLCHRSIQSCLSQESSVRKLPLPSKLRSSIAALFCPTIKGYIPSPQKLREFVCIPPPQSERLYCTMIKQDDDSLGGYYMLYLEFLGGLIPLLKGKRASKLRPEFIVYDPKIRLAKKYKNRRNSITEDDDMAFASSESEDNILSSEAKTGFRSGSFSPRTPRKRQKKHRGRCTESVEMSEGITLADLLYCDDLPESDKLLEITSNIWGTKFRIQGLASFLPDDIGTVTYKTSLLHLQPRQMTIHMVELSKDHRDGKRKRSRTSGPLSSGNMPSYQPSSPKSTVAVQTEHGTSVSTSEQYPRSCSQPPTKEHSQDNHPHDQKSLPDIKRQLIHHQMPSPEHCPLFYHQKPGLDPTLPPTPTHHRRIRKCSNPYLAEIENSMEPIEVPVMIHSSPQHHTQDNGNRVTHTIEGKAMDDSPPHRKSPGRGGFKSRSLSPAEQIGGHYIMDGGSECVTVVSREMFSSNMTSKRHLTKSPILNTTVKNKDKCDNRNVLSASQYDPAGPDDISIISSVDNLQNNNSASVLSAKLQKDSDNIKKRPPQYRSPFDSSHCQQTSVPKDVETVTNRWAERPLVDLRYIDDDADNGCHSPEKKDTVYAATSDVNAKTVMQDNNKPCGLSSASTCNVVKEYSLSQLEQRLSMPEMDTSKRVVLSQLSVPDDFRGKDTPVHKYRIQNRGSRCIEVIISDTLQHAGSNMSIDSYDSGSSTCTTPQNSRPPSPNCFSSGSNSPSLFRKFPLFSRRGSEDRNQKKRERASSTTRIEGRRDSSTDTEMKTDLRNASGSTSLPNSPNKTLVNQSLMKLLKMESSNYKDKNTSPLHSRILSPRGSKKRMKNYNCAQDSSEEEMVGTSNTTEQVSLTTTSENYRNLATFQKAQLSKKMRKVRSKADKDNREKFSTNSPSHSPSKSAKSSPSRKTSVHPDSSSKYLVMHNKAPLWNENSQVYQLDFGGRVTQESAKNFQIEYQGKQVMQFGRIDTNAYTLDFQYPFSASQAFAVALANVTQRLK